MHRVMATSSTLSALPSSAPTTSPLLNLPPELRARIFSFALLPTFPSTPHTIHRSAPKYLSLQLTSHSVSHETRLSPFHLCPLSLPATFRSNVAATLRFLRKLQRWQVREIRKVELSMLGSVHESGEASRVMRWLTMEKEDAEVVRKGWVGSPEVAAAAFAFGNERSGSEEERMQLRRRKQNEIEDEYVSGLRELDIKITSTDVMTPMADPTMGMEKMLDLETSPLFVELVGEMAKGKYPSLNHVSVSVELGPRLKGTYTLAWVEEWKTQLEKKLNDMGEGEGKEGHKDAADGKECGVPVLNPADERERNHQGRDVKVDVKFSSPSETLAMMSAYFTALGGDENYYGWGFGGASASSRASVMGGAMMSLGMGASGVF